MQNRNQIPGEIWTLIFANLEPCFLYDVLQVSRKFNHLATSDSFFEKKLSQYFSDQDLQAIPIDSDQKNKKKLLFSKIYSKKFSTLKSSTSRRLLSYIIEEDIDQIQKFGIGGKQLFKILQEQDVDGNDMLVYINRTNNERVSLAVINLYLEPCKKRYLSYNPLTMFDVLVEKLICHLFSMPPISQKDMINIWELSAALNCRFIASIEDLNPEFGHIYDAALRQAIRFGHSDAIDIILKYYDKFEHTNLFDEDKPLVIAAKFNSEKNINQLLTLFPTHIDLDQIKVALVASAKYGSTSVAEKLLNTYLGNIGRIQDLYAYSSVFETAVECGRADIVELILNRTTDRTNQTISRAIEDSLEKVSRNGDVEVARVLLNHGAVPDSYHKYIAKEKNQLSILHLFKEFKHPEKSGHIDGSTYKRMSFNAR